MKASLRNSREDSANHNDRTFNSEEKVAHPERTKDNEYIVVRPDGKIESVEGGKGHFRANELAFYEQYYSEDLERKNAHYKSKGNHKAVKTMEQFLDGKNSKPMGEILQIGSMKDGAPPREVVEACVTEYIQYIQNTYPNMHILDFAYHADEETDHIHMRFIMDYINEHGMLCPNQKEALREMGFERPFPDEPEGRYNNAMITFTDTIREKWYEIIQEHGIDLDTIPSEERKEHKSTRQYKNEQIIQGQEETIQTNNEKITHQQTAIEETEKRSEQLTKSIEKKEETNAKLDEDISDKAIKDKALDTAISQKVATLSELDGREKALAERENSLAEKEKTISTREIAINAKEASFNDREKAVKSREKALEAREALTDAKMEKEYRGLMTQFMAKKTGNKNIWSEFIEFVHSARNKLKNKELEKIKADEPQITMEHDDYTR